MLHKIVVVATIATIAIAQPYYKTGSPVTHNVIVCTADSTCQTTPEGKLSLCYTVKAMAGGAASTATPPVYSGGTAVGTLNLCMPSGYAD